MPNKLLYGLTTCNEKHKVRGAYEISEVSGAGMYKERPFYATCIHGVSSRLWAILSIFEEHLFMVCTIIGIMFLALLFPDFSEKVHVNKKLKEMEKTLHNVTHEVRRAEVACFTAAENVYHLQNALQDDTTETVTGQQDLAVCTSAYIPITKSEPVKISEKADFDRKIFVSNKNSSHKEVALMSYIYTDSFDVEKPEDVATATTEA